MQTWFSPHGSEWEAETYEEALEMERDSLVEQLEALRSVLADARVLAIRVADKNIGPLSDQAREVQGAANDVLNDLPTFEEVAGLLADSIPAISPDHGWHESAAHTPVLQPLGVCGLVSADGRYACIKDIGHEGPHGSDPARESDE